MTLKTSVKKCFSETSLIVLLAHTRTKILEAHENHRKDESLMILVSIKLTVIQYFSTQLNK